MNPRSPRSHRSHRHIPSGRTGLFLTSRVGVEVVRYLVQYKWLRKVWKSRDVMSTPLQPPLVLVFFLLFLCIAHS
jgi:hypothetical protein